jgi:acetyl esterase/lipase
MTGRHRISNRSGAPIEAQKPLVVLLSTIVLWQRHSRRVRFWSFHHRTRSAAPLVGFLLLAALVTACYPPVTVSDRYVAVAYQPEEITVVRDLVYAQGERVNGEVVDLLVDIHHPPLDGRARPTMALIHGGGFIIGNQTVHHPQALEWAQRGYVVATPTYRLVEDRPDQMLETGPGLAAAADIQLAIRWLRDNAATYDIDPDRLAVAGLSSGGVLALLAAQTTDLTDGRSASAQSHIPQAVFVTGTTHLPTLLEQGHIRSDTVAAPVLLHQYELDTVSGATGDDARFACLVWASEPSTHRCTPTISPGPGHFIFFTAVDDYARTQFQPFLAAELDLANAAAP